MIKKKTFFKKFGKFLNSPWGSFLFLTLNFSLFFGVLFFYNKKFSKFLNKPFFISRKVEIEDNRNDSGQAEETNYGVRQSWISLLLFILIE